MVGKSVNGIGVGDGGEVAVTVGIGGSVLLTISVARRVATAVGVGVAEGATATVGVIVAVAMLSVWVQPLATRPKNVRSATGKKDFIFIVVVE